MHKLISAVCLSITMPSICLASSSVPKILINMEYSAGKNILLQSGWTPVAEPGVTPMIESQPETASCSSAGWCQSFYRNNDGEKLNVSTVGFSITNKDGTIERPMITNISIVNEFPWEYRSTGTPITKAKTSPPTPTKKSEKEVAVNTLNTITTNPSSELIDATSKIYTSFYNEIHKTNPKHSSWGAFCQYQVEQAGAYWQLHQELLSKSQQLASQGFSLDTSGASTYRTILNIYNRKLSQGIDIPHLNKNELKTIELQTHISHDFGLSKNQNDKLILEICEYSAVK